MPAYRDEKRKTWYAKFRYNDWQGKIKQTTKRGFKTKKDALNYEYEFKATSKDGNNITVNKLAEKFIEDRKAHTKPSNYIRLERALKKWVLPFLGELRLKELTPGVVREWQNMMVQSGLKASSLKTFNRRCSSLFNFAVKYYGLRINPISITGSIGHAERSNNFWTVEEFYRFIENVVEPKYKICFLILFYSGMRLGELLALEAGDFDFVQNRISISKSKMLINGEISTPKTIYSVRVIDMPIGVMQAVKEYMEQLDEIPNPVFGMYNSALSVSIHKYAKRAGVKEIRLHDLRHSHASFLINSGVPITTISKRLGHRSPKITLEVYSHMYEKSAEQVTNLLQDAFVSGEKWGQNGVENN